MSVSVILLSCISLIFHWKELVVGFRFCCSISCVHVCHFRLYLYFINQKETFLNFFDCFSFQSKNTQLSILAFVFWRFSTLNLWKNLKIQLRQTCVITPYFYDFNTRTFICNFMAWHSVLLFGLKALVEMHKYFNINLHSNWFSYV